MYKNKNNNITEIVELYGNNFIGKTSYAISLINKNDIALYIDVDNKLNNNIEYPINMYIYRDNNISNIHEFIKKSIHCLDIIIIDSLPNICNDKNIYNLQYDFSIFKTIREIISLCKKYNCKLVIVNQLRKNKDNKKKSFGIRALGLYYTKRIHILDNNKVIITKNLH